VVAAARPMLKSDFGASLLNESLTARAPC
jgi:hypothetical protein